MRAFKEDITIVSPDKTKVEALIDRLHEWIESYKMQFKQSKDWWQSLYKVKPAPNTYFIGNECVTKLAEQTDFEEVRWKNNSSVW